MQNREDSKISKQSIFTPKTNPEKSIFDVIDGEHTKLIKMIDEANSPRTYHFLSNSVEHYISTVLFQKHNDSINKDIKELTDYLQSMQDIHKINLDTKISEHELPYLKTLISNLKTSINMQTALKKAELSQPRCCTIL